VDLEGLSPLATPFFERLEISWLASQRLICGACGNNSVEYSFFFFA
jgi:hypothetical protein